VTTKPKGRPCAAISKKTGEPCKMPVYRDGETLCTFHRKTSEDQRRAQAAQVRSRRVKKHDMHALRQEVTEVKALDVAAKLLGGIPLDSPDSARTYLGKRKVTHEGTVIGLHILLALTGPHLTPSAARTALLDAVPEGMRPSFVPPVEDIYRANRAEWRKASIRYREATGLFVDSYPPTMIAPWEHVDEVTKNEPLPTFEDWTVEPLGDSPTHVLARSPRGDEVIVRRGEIEKPPAVASV
jgi:hypothetical protein